MNMFDAGKTRMIGHGEKKTVKCVKPFLSDTGSPERYGQTDGRIELLYQYRASVC